MSPSCGRWVAWCPAKRGGARSKGVLGRENHDFFLCGGGEGEFPGFLMAWPGSEEALVGVKSGGHKTTRPRHPGAPQSEIILR